MANQQEIAKLLITIEGQITDLKKDLGAASSEVKKFDRKSKGAFDGMKKSVTGLRTNWLLLAGAIGGAVLAIRNLSQVWGNFEHKMHEVRTLLKLTNKEFENLKSGVLDLTGKVPQTAQELAAALYDIVSAGVAVGKSLDVLELSAKAAVAGVTDTKTAAGTGIGVINAYGMEISELSNVYDTLFQTVKLGVVTFPELASSIGTALPVARLAGVNFTDLAASIAVLTKNKIQAQKATTFLRSGITALAASTPAALAEMKKIGITWRGWIPTLKQIHDKGITFKQMRGLIPDIRAGQAIISLAQNFDKLNDTLDKFAEKKDSMQDAFDIMKESPVNQMKMLGNQINKLKIAIVKLVAPAVLIGVQKLTGGLEKLSGVYNEYLKATMGEERKYEVHKAQRNTVKELEKIEKQLKKNKKALEDLEVKEIRQKERKQYIWLTGTLGEIKKTKAEIYKLEWKQYTLGKKYNELEEERLKLFFEARKEKEKDDDGNGKGNGEDEDGEDEDGEDEEITTTGAVQKVALDRLRIYKAQVKDILADLQYAYKQNQISIEEYYTKIREELNRTYLKEVHALENLLDATTNENKRKEIQNEITAKGVELQTKLTQAYREEAEAQKTLTEKTAEANRALAEKQQQVEEILSEAEARLTDAQSTELERRYNEVDRQYMRMADRIIEFDLKTNERRKALKRAFDIWQAQREEARLQYEKEMQLKRLDIASQATGGIKQIFDELYTASGEKVKAFFYLSKTAALADAAVNGALAIIKALAVGGPAGIILAGIVSGLVGVQTGIIAGQMLSGPPKAEGMVEGGSVQGSGGVDTIPKMLTRREFVQPVSAVDHYGSGVMEAIRRKAIPKGLLMGYSGFIPRISGAKMAEGGVVSGSGNDRQEGTIQIVNLVDHDLFAQYLNTRSGSDAILNIISSNAYSVKRRIGI